MRTLAWILLFFAWSINANSDGTRLGQIRPGMTRTDVAIEVGKPADVRAEGDVTLWTYPSSATEICTVKFVNGKVANDVMKCDSSEASKEVASRTAYMLSNMSSETEYTGRVQRYCGTKPQPKMGCRVERCVNGEWEVVCN